MRYKVIDWVIWSCLILRIDSGVAYIADKTATRIKYRVCQHHTLDSETDWLTFASSHIHILHSCNIINDVGKSAELKKF